ncbi:MAG: cellulase family glycosylhydrolase [Anaerolineae bacterium]|nr:cellulase family glycosylhydrolase [Anaerolineae bacterium]
MMTQARGLYVQTESLNIRTDPWIEAGNVVDQLSAGDLLEVLVDRAEQSPDGWVWRRLAGHEQRWAAEVNRHTGRRLLAETPPEPPALIESDVLYVIDNALPIYDRPDPAGTHVGTLPVGGRAELGVERRLVQDGWVWRPLNAAPETGWVRVYNARTLARLLSRKPPAGQAQGRVRTDGRRFVLDGRPFRFVGANLREFVFYPRPDILPFAREEHQAEQLAAMTEMGMRVARLHACHRQVPVSDARELLGSALDRLHQHGLLALVVLNDALGSYWVHGDERFHTHVLGHLDKHAYFHDEGYSENYLPFVRDVVSTYADHPAVFAWELGNEYAIHPQPATIEDGEAFLRFVQVVSDTIRANDLNHLVTIGLVNTGHVAPNDRPGLNRFEYGKRLYSLPNVDFLTVHFYEDNGEEQNSLPDLEIARQVNKPLVVEEWGAVGGEQVGLTVATLQSWFGQGAAGLLQWGLSATRSDIGVGDNEYGMDPYAENNKHHYHPLLGVYREWAQRLRDAGTFEDGV